MGVFVMPVVVAVPAMSVALVAPTVVTMPRVLAVTLVFVVPSAVVVPSVFVVTVRVSRVPWWHVHSRSVKASGTPGLRAMSHRLRLTP